MQECYSQNILGGHSFLNMPLPENVVSTDCNIEQQNHTKVRDFKTLKNGQELVLNMQLSKHSCNHVLHKKTEKGWDLPNVTTLHKI